jgi:hypothetical protein
MFGEDMVLDGRLVVTQFGLEIELDDESLWYLDIKVRVHIFIGRRVTISGIRTTFDRLAATYIEGV